MADPLMELSAGGALGLSGGPLGQNAAAAAAGAQGVLVKDILSAEEELRVRLAGVGENTRCFGRVGSLCRVVPQAEAVF
jgi:hypothetical protein